MKIILGESPRLLPWAAELMPFQNFTWGPNCNTIGVENKDGDLIAVAVYHDYYPSCGVICMSLAAKSPRWATPRVFAEMLAFPFLGLGCQRITTYQPEGLTHAHKLVEGVGFKLEGVMRRGFGDRDARIYGLLREDAERWLCKSQIFAYNRDNKETDDG